MILKTFASILLFLIYVALLIDAIMLAHVGYVYWETGNIEETLLTYGVGLLGAMALLGYLAYILLSIRKVDKEIELSEKCHGHG